jgi:hypothetical protein
MYKEGGKGRGGEGSGRTRLPAPKRRGEGGRTPTDGARRERVGRGGGLVAWVGVDGLLK